MAAACTTISTHHLVDTSTVAMGVTMMEAVAATAGGDSGGTPVQAEEATGIMAIAVVDVGTVVAVAAAVGRKRSTKRPLGCQTCRWLIRSSRVLNKRAGAISAPLHCGFKIKNQSVGG